MKRIKNCPYKPGSYVGLDVVFGAVTGEVTIELDEEDIIFKEWSREFDGRAPLYFKSKEDFVEQLNKGGNEIKLDGFYLPF